MAISVSRLIIGWALIIIGIGLTVLSFFTAFIILIYGIPLIIIGFAILFNKNEDKIEKRKDLKERLYKK